MIKESVVLFARVPVLAESAKSRVQPGKIEALTLEVANLGYSLDAELRNRLCTLSEEGFVLLRQELLGGLSEASGAHVCHAALFNGFPYETPDQWDYMVKRLMGYLQHEFDMRPNQGQVLSCGHVVDLRLFDLEAFGACPICQHQTEETEARENVQHDFCSITPLKSLGLADEDFLRERASAMLGRLAPLAPGERDFLMSVRPLGGLTRPEKVFRENLPLAYLFFGDDDYVASLLSGATDVLRIAAALSDREADLSLKAPVRFKIATRHKKRLLRLLETRQNLEEDMLRHRERWLRLGEKLNPGSRKNRAAYPRVAEAFDRLRNDPSSIESFQRRMERALRQGTVDKDILDDLAARPGEFFRRLDWVLRAEPMVDELLPALSRAADSAGLKTLFEMRKYLSWRAATQKSGKGGRRVFIPKGRETRLQVAEDRRTPISETVLDATEERLSAALFKRLAGHPEIGVGEEKVYLDPALKSIVLPFNRRGDAKASRPLGKGSRYAMGEAPVIRLFVWWKGDGVDVDLSMSAYDADFKSSKTVSWQGLRSDGIVHSGDIQSAPDGASEFIDIEVESLLGQGMRYAVPSLIVYRGGRFADFPCFAGFMERDSLRSGKKFEPESVALKFDLDSETTSHLPLIFDLKERQMIFADISGGLRGYSTMSGSQSKFTALAEAVLDLPARKVTAWDVLEVFHGERLVEEAASADRCYLADDVNPLEIAALLEDAS